jgi:hypothetical protein
MPISGNSLVPAAPCRPHQDTLHALLGGQHKTPEEAPNLRDTQGDSSPRAALKAPRLLGMGWGWRRGAWREPTGPTAVPDKVAVARRWSRPGSVPLPPGAVSLLKRAALRELRWAGVLTDFLPAYLC